MEFMVTKLEAYYESTNTILRPLPQQYGHAEHRRLHRLGSITALFIPSGWLPNEQLAKMVGPFLTYALPLLIAFQGGKIVGGLRGAVMGAIATVGVITGTTYTMFLGAWSWVRWQACHQKLTKLSTATSNRV